MSDLAPFVAAALRDKVISEMHQEILELRAQLEQEKQRSQTVSITGPEGTPVYASALVANGNYDQSPELWKIEFPTSDQQGLVSRPCKALDLMDMEVRIGGICKARMSNGVVEGFVNDVKNNYDHVLQRGTISIWFGGSSGIWLNIQVQPIERRAFVELRNFDLGEDTFLNTLLHFVPRDAKIWYTDVSFLISHINGAMKRWELGGMSDDDSTKENTARSNNNGNEETATTVHRISYPSNQLFEV
eukprot:Nitzschia sp. Nitz4//scaffold100_size80364//14446//15180//NITZ4_005337-RA/size80364-processed-gene-0.48-mRNA-1//-1//CDS//3329532073//835//frame0